MDVDVFKKQLENLNKVLDGLKKQEKQQRVLTAQMQKFNQGINTARTSAERLLATFRGIFSVVKSIGFSSMMFGSVMGVKGVLAQKEYAKAKTLDLSTHELKALKYAGGQSQTADRDFLVNLASTLKNSLYTTDKAHNWASLGFDTETLKSLNTIDLLKTFISSVNARGLGDVGQNKNLQDILEGLSDISLGDLKNINPEEIWSNYERGLKITDGSGEKIKEIGKGVNTLITAIETFTDKIQATLAPAFKTLLDSISNGLAKLYNSKEFGDWLNKLSSVMDSMSGSAVDYISNLTRSIPDLLRDMKIIFLQIMSGLGATAQVFTIGLNSNVNRFAKNIDKQLAQAQEDKFQDLKQRLRGANTKKDLQNAYDSLMDFTDGGETLSKANFESLKMDFLKRSEELKNQTQKQASQEHQVTQPINITIHNDPELITQTHTLTNSINLGGWGNSMGGR